MTKPTAANAIAQVVGRIAVDSLAAGEVEFNLLESQLEAIGSNELQSLSVGTAALAASAVTTAKVAAANITEPLLALPTANVLNARRVAKFTYDFAVLGGAQGPITLTGEALPANAVVCGGRVYIITHPDSAASTATIALHVEAANDIVSAIIVSNAQWLAANPSKAIIPVNTAATDVVCTVSRPLIATIATQNLTVGKFEVWLDYYVHGT